jgi:hypothetical protein
MNGSGEKLELHLGVLQRVAFFILKACRFFQNSISMIYWFVVERIFVYSAWRILDGDTHEKLRRIRFFKKNPVAYAYGNFLKYLIIFNGWLNGLHGSYTSYDLLLRWNPSIPLIALKHKKATYSLYWLGHEYQNEKGVYPLIDMSSLGISDIYGHFIIVSKKLGHRNPSQVLIDCVWLTGEHQGEKFTIDNGLYLTSDETRQQ